MPDLHMEIEMLRVWEVSKARQTELWWLQERVELKCRYEENHPKSSFFSRRNRRMHSVSKGDQSGRDRTFPTAILGSGYPSPSFSPTATGPRRMSSSNYELLPQEGAGSGDALYDERASTHSGPVRPPTYYGEGPFDPPSSDDEDESLLKENSRSLGMIERAGYAEPDVKVRPHRSTSN